MSRRTVFDVMTSPAVTVDVDTPYHRIAELLAEHDISALPVLDAGNDLVGVVSEGDLMAKPETYDQLDPPPSARFGHARAVRHKADATSAHDLMSSPAITVTETATVAEAARIMDRHRVKRLPVLDGTGRLVGIMSRADVLRLFLRKDEELREEILREVFERVLWTDTDAIEVRVREGMVTLLGRLDNRTDVDLAARLTATQDGVVAVDNQLTCESDEPRRAPASAGR